VARRSGAEHRRGGVGGSMASLPRLCLDPHQWCGVAEQAWRGAAEQSGGAGRSMASLPRLCPDPRRRRVDPRRLCISGQIRLDLVPAAVHLAGAVL
jgi:hypothetical protein